IQGKDEKRTRQFLELALNVLEQELQRQEAKQKIEKITIQGTEAVKIGSDLYLARAGASLLISNRDKALEMGLAPAAGPGGKSLADNPSVQEARKLLPGDTLASLWLNMETVRQAPGAEAFYKTPREAFFTITLGPILDVLGRTPFVCAGIARSPQGYLATIR